jgi:GMP synthase (glutamine-hydrolysing)
MADDARLKSKLWVQAALRTCQSIGMSGFVVRRGDEDAGAVLIKQNFLGTGFRVLTQIRQPDGQRAWIPGTGADPVGEAEADAYVARQVARDSDLWVIEIEDRDGRLPFAEPVI